MPKVKYKCEKYILEPTQGQIKILLKWVNLYESMYNQTIKFFKVRKYNGSTIITDFKKIRTEYLKETKENISKNNKIPSHMLDLAIKDACSMYKSMLTNIKNKNIKHFRLRYIKQTKASHIIKLEKTMFTKNRKLSCVSQLGDNMIIKNHKKFPEINCDCTLQYKYNKFILLVPVEIKRES